MAGERLADGDLGVAAVIAPGGIVVVDALFHGIVDHLVDRALVDLGVVAAYDRQTHGAHAERRELEPLEILVQHVSSFPPWLARATAGDAVASRLPTASGRLGNRRVCHAGPNVLTRQAA